MDALAFSSDACLCAFIIPSLRRQETTNAQLFLAALSLESSIFSLYDVDVDVHRCDTRRQRFLAAVLNRPPFRLATQYTPVE